MPESKIILGQPGSPDIIHGGLYFGNLTPGGSFSNTPSTIKYTPPSIQTQNNVVLTLKKIKDSLKNSLQSEYNYSNTDLSNDAIVEQYLYDFVNLLIDYSDLRNFVFFGSAYVEVAYNIKQIIANFPFQTLISDLVSSFSNITITNNSANDTSEIVFTTSAITDYGSFTSFDEGDNKFNFNNYDLLDSSGQRYSILEGFAPYDSPSISDIVAIVDGTDGIRITTASPNYFSNGDVIEIYEVQGTLNANETFINVNFNIVNSGFNYIKRYVVTNRTSTTFELLNEVSLDSTLKNFTYISGGKVRKYPLTGNQIPFTFKIVVEGIVTQDQFLTFTLPDTTDARSGFILAPKIKISNDFSLNLTPIQKQLLAPIPINQVPWPTRPVTNNIQYVIDTVNVSNTEQDFVTWLNNPNLLRESTIADGSDGPDIAYADVLTEFNILSASATDESDSNQLLRRAIPYDVINEIYDADLSYFQRFILIAGWFFDQVWLYTKFIKYVHSINYTDFNQLSPQYYKLYADHYGFDLFSDDSIDFSSLVIQTEPGIAYVNQGVDLQNKYYRVTIQQLEYERQKRLLLSLFYLYKTKGTQSCITKLVSLLGAPEGLLQISEYAMTFNTVNKSDYHSGNSKTRVVDNQKVYVPDFHFEIDPQFLVDPTNIANPLNKPYVYKLRLHNESTVNLREIGIETNPSISIDTFLEQNFGTLTSDYLTLSNGEFCSLQDVNNPHYLLPLNIPDKFTGISLEYMIPRDGFTKGVGTNLEEVSIILCYLNKVANLSNISPKTVTNAIVINSGTQCTVTVTAHTLTVGEKIRIYNVSGIANLNSDFTVIEVPDANTFTVNGEFSGIYSSVTSGQIIFIVPNILSSGFNYSYYLPEVYSNYGTTSISTDLTQSYKFDYLKRTFSSSTLISTAVQEYVLCRLEGNDLVVRIRLLSETNSDLYERVTICENIFQNDGLNHTLRLIMRSEGVEVYKDYEFIELALWKDPITNAGTIPYLALEIPKYEIASCEVSILPLDNLIAFPNNQNNDVLNWWDMLIGFPNNINFKFKGIEVFEDYGIDSYNIGDNITDTNNDNVDSYKLVFTNSTEDTNHITNTKISFLKASPNITNTDYGYLLPSDTFNNLVIVKSLNLISFNQASTNTKLTNQIQDFFNHGDPFQNFAWQKDIHNNYEYDNFNSKLVKLYELYSPKVLNYQSLNNFLSLIENKFKPTIQQFIPIVVNLSEFGRVLQGSIYTQGKYRYTNTNYSSTGGNLAQKAYIQDRVYDFDPNYSTAGDYNLDFDSDFYTNGLTNYFTEGIPIYISIIKPDNSYLLGPITVTWDFDIVTMLHDMATAVNNIAINSYYPYIKASVLCNIFRIEIDYDYMVNIVGIDPNTLRWRATDGTIIRTVNFTGGKTAYNTSVGTINYMVPPAFRAPQAITYFASENKTINPLYFAAELKPPIYI